MTNIDERINCEFTSSTAKLLREQTDHFDLEAELILRKDMSTTMMAGAALTLVHDAFFDLLGQTLLERGDDPDRYFENEYLLPIWHDPYADGDTCERVFLSLIEENPQKAADQAFFFQAMIALSFAVQALKAEENSHLAWTYTVSAAHWAGILRAAPFGKKIKAGAATVMAKSRHRDHMADRKIIEEYWRKNIDPKLSAEKAAIQIERAEIVKTSHKKIAEIISALRRGGVKPKSM
jgi:hypothetical protein